MSHRYFPEFRQKMEFNSTALVRINPDKVIRFAQQDDDETAIFFDGAVYIIVKDSFNEVSDKLKAAHIARSRTNLGKSA
jgi:hypothetical protein